MDVCRACRCISSLYAKVMRESNCNGIIDVLEKETVDNVIFSKESGVALGINRKQCYCIKVQPCKLKACAKHHIKIYVWGFQIDEQLELYSLES